MKRSKYLLDLCLTESIILYFWQVLELFHKLIKELHVLQFLHVSESNKEQSKVGIISNFTKGETFHFLWQSSVHRGNLNVTPLLEPSKNDFLFPSFWPRIEHTWTLKWMENLLICFENCLGVPSSHRQSRDRMMNTFIIVNMLTLPLI